MSFDMMHMPGPCVVCGDTNYTLSCGGPTICPKCDCGNFDAATVMKQAKVIADLREQLRGLAQASADPFGTAAIAEDTKWPDPIAFINRRLEDLAEANALYAKDQRLGAPDKIARNDREISWLKDLRSMIVLASSVPSAQLGCGDPSCKDPNCEYGK